MYGLFSLIDHASFSLAAGCSSSFLEKVQQAALLSDAPLTPLAFFHNLPQIMARHSELPLLYCTVATVKTVTQCILFFKSQGLHIKRD